MDPTDKGMFSKEYVDQNRLGKLDEVKTGIVRRVKNGDIEEASYLNGVQHGLCRLLTYEGNGSEIKFFVTKAIQNRNKWETEIVAKRVYEESRGGNWKTK